MNKEFDIIIVGAGSAGCVLANRLSARPDLNVLLLEAGDKDNWVWFKVPVGYLFAIGNPRADWMFNTTPQDSLGGRSLAYPRGKTLGGSSAINAMISMRGQKADYEGWKASGLTDWGWDDVLPAFKRIEDHFLGDTDHHGSGGEWRVEYPRVQWDILDALRDAGEEMGIPKTEDFNTGDNEGSGYFHVNQKNGVRWSSARGFLKPIMKRPNLHVETGVTVESLIIENGRLTGVAALKGKQTCTYQAKAGVVLSSGSIGSVQILQRSGIGPAESLKAAGIWPLQDKPRIGGNLQDHLQQRAIYKVSNTNTLNQAYHSVFGKARMGLDYALFRKGPLTMAPSQVGIFTRSDDNQPRPNIQFHLQPLSLDRFGEPLHKFPAITVAACNLRPTSRGTVRITGPTASDGVDISPNYLSTDEDRKIAADAIRVTRRLMSQPTLFPYAPEEFLPGPTVSDDQHDLERAAGQIGTTIFHPVGTIAMGGDNDPTSPLDQRFRFRSLEKLWVVDASAMPFISSGNTNTPTIMMAERGAEMILEDLKA
ncbi:MAG: choline dehydrogenase [Ponticaulis sp.]|nr:choline dehydrogenase [Ponticaulis sp.]